MGEPGHCRMDDEAEGVRVRVLFKRQGKPMQTDIGMIVGGIFLVIVGIFWVVEQRRAVKAYNARLAQTRAENRELIELQRETNRLLALIAEKLDRTQK